MSEQDPVRTTLDVPGEPAHTTLDPGTREEPRSTTLDPVPGGPARTTLDPGTTAPASRVDHRLQPGMALDYELRERLGGGGEATVYRALDRRHDREVAIKIYHVVPHYAFEIGDEKHKQHFRHEHTVDLYERREENALHIEVMELCPLGTLETLAGGEPMSSEMLHKVVREVSEAIESMHPMYHGDVKPQNILVRSREPLDLVLTDFGLARDMEGRDRITSLGHRAPTCTSRRREPRRRGSRAIGGRSGSSSPSSRPGTTRLTACRRTAVPGNACVTSWPPKRFRWTTWMTSEINASATSRKAC